MTEDNPLPKKTKFRIIMDIVWFIVIIGIILIAANHDIKEAEQEMNSCHAYVEKLGQYYVEDYLDFKEEIKNKTKN